MLKKIIISLPRSVKQIIVLINDFVTCLFTTWVAFSVRYDNLQAVNSALIICASISAFILIPIFIKLGLYRAIFRYTGRFASLTHIKAILIYTLFYSITIGCLDIEGVPRSIAIIQPVLLYVATGISRLIAKQILSRTPITSNDDCLKKSYVMIYGAGVAGQQIASSLIRSNEFHVIGYLDDNDKLWNGMIGNIPVFDPIDIEKFLIGQERVTDVLIAIPSASKKQIQTILSFLSRFKIHVRIIPSISELACGKFHVMDMREVEIEDILGRDFIEPNPNLLRKNLYKKSVLVTGGGGSIGSELCRQILKQNPTCLVIYELSEYALYKIELELKKYMTDVVIVPVLGSVLDKFKLTKLIIKYDVQTLYHAAAYKHVPMIEANPAAGVWNNVFGTLRVIEVACECSIETLVLISTDKAVRPTNVMGCTKRIAEMLLQAKAKTTTTTKLTMVRFGNVLGSSGSVVPLFREQIKNGGPITVTHPEIVRYFMTIPEAAQLVIQAGAIGHGGDVMVLDMGEPVKILDLAKRMISLSGFSVKDEISHNINQIEIKFSGLRPGEKLYEELLIGSNSIKTEHPRIMRATESYLEVDQLLPMIERLKLAVKDEDSDLIITLLGCIVHEYKPTIH